GMLGKDCGLRQVPVMRLCRLRLAVCLGLVVTCWLLWRRAGNSSNNSDREVCIATSFKALKLAGWSGDVRRDSFQTRSAAVDWDRLSDACQSELAPDEGHRAAGPVPERCFVEKLSRPVRLKAMQQLGRLADELERAGVDFYLDMGTALGALRHLEMIPYDEDIDLRIDEEQKAAAKIVLEKLRYKWPGMLFQDTEWLNQHWKVHLRDILDPVLDRPVAIDIFFYQLNRTTDQLLIREPPFSFPIGDIFPTRRRPFHGRWYRTPNSIESMIVGYFPNSSLAECVYYLHDDSPFASCSRPVVPCRALADRFDFASTIQLGSGQLQLLRAAAAAGRWRAAGLAYVAGADRL
ncbi:hypothetical protein BOX15_Mlig029704g3, partial [Macrostomum lignano]